MPCSEFEAWLIIGQISFVPLAPTYAVCRQRIPQSHYTPRPFRCLFVHSEKIPELELDGIFDDNPQWNTLEIDLVVEEIPGSPSLIWLTLRSWQYLTHLLAS